MNNTGKFSELKIVLGILGIFLFVFLVSGANYSSPATGNIYECGNITTPGNYSLNQSFVAINSGYGNACILISAHNVSIDGRGFTIRGSNTSIQNGIKAWNFENITIMNINMSNFTTSVNFTNSRNVTFHEYNISTYYFQNLTDSYFLRPIYGLIGFQKQINTSGTALWDDLMFNNNSLFYSSSKFPVIANLTFYNLANLGSYPYPTFEGNPCGVSCINTTSLSASTVKLNVPQGGTYEIQANFSQYNISLNYGWNYFSIVDPSNVQTVQVNITAITGYYLLGVSSQNNLSIADLGFFNGTETEVMNWYNSARNKNVFYPVGLYNNTGQKQGIRWLDINETKFFTSGSSIWLRLNNSGNISLSIQGSPVDFRYSIRNLTFYNSTGSSLNYTSARSEGWIGVPGQTNSQIFRYWNNEDNGFDFITGGDTSQNLTAYQGYNMWARLSNITMVIST